MHQRIVNEALTRRRLAEAAMVKLEAGSKRVQASDKHLRKV